MQFAKIDRSSVTEQIIEYLKDQILKQELKPGQQLPSEENLGSQLGVGRGTVREALRVLVYLGLIERRNKSTYVTSIATSGSMMTGFLDRIHKHRDVMKVIEVRKIVEPEAAALAAERGDAEEIAEIGRCLAEMELMKNIQQYMHQNQLVVLRLSPSIEPHSLEFHRRLYAAILEGKEEDARDIMKAHILDIEKEMVGIIKNGSGGQLEGTL
jgi:DNA-binding FadR family transcriptional regulator